MQGFTWEAREQRKPLKRKAPRPGRHHGGGERGCDSWGGGAIARAEEKEGGGETDRLFKQFTVGPKTNQSLDRCPLCPVLMSDQIAHINSSFQSTRLIGRSFCLLRVPLTFVPVSDTVYPLLIRGVKCIKILWYYNTATCQYALFIYYIYSYSLVWGQTVGSQSHAYYLC